MACFSPEILRRKVSTRSVIARSTQLAIGGKNRVKSWACRIYPETDESDSGCAARSKTDAGHQGFLIIEKHASEVVKT
jgi:hypothetical protein